MRWHAHHHTEGTGHLYQGRFKTFPIEVDEYFVAVARYVERNPLRAGLSSAAQEWRYGSAWRNVHGDRVSRALLADWPLPRPRGWRGYVNKPQTEAEVVATGHCLLRGTPLGSDAWVAQAAARLRLTHTLRPRGRPRAEK